MGSERGTGSDPAVAFAAGELFPGGLEVAVPERGFGCLLDGILSHELPQLLGQLLLGRVDHPVVHLEALGDLTAKDKSTFDPIIREVSAILSAAGAASP